MAGQPQSVERTHKGALASTFGTIHEARLSLPQPVGAFIPPTLGYTLATLDPGNVEITGAIRERLLGEGALPGGAIVDRSRKGDFGVARAGDRVVAHKGDRLKPAPQPEAAPEQQRAEAAPSAPAVAQQEVAPVAQQDSAPPDAPQQDVAQQEVGPPLSLAPPTATAQIDVVPIDQPEPSGEAQEQPAAETGGYALASAGEYRPVAIA